jgi:DNA-binding SARP family transcriptional activator/Tfp pilus assembly protein PilF
MAVVPPFRLRTLGSLQLTAPDGSREPSLATRRRKLALLTLLAVRGRPLSRDRLVNLFWGDHPEERARHSLSDALSHLRRVLGPDAITARQAEVGLAEELPLTVDLRELVEAAQARDWPRVLALHEGPFLDGVYIGGSADWEHWVLAQRSHALRLFLSACRAEGERLAAAGEWGALERVATRWLEASPEDPAALRLHGMAVAQLEAVQVAPRSEGEPSALMPSRTVAPRAAASATAEGPVDTGPEASAGAQAPARPARTGLDAPARPAGPPWRRPRFVAGAMLAVLALGALAVRRWDQVPAAAAVAFTTHSPEARRLMERASAGSDGGVSRTEAIALLTRAIALDSGFAMAYRTLALLHAGDRAGHPEVARLLTRATSAAQGVTPAERALVESSYHLLVTGDLARAAEAQRRLLRLVPHDGDAWHELGMTYQYLGDEGRAATAYREALAHDRSSASTWANLLEALVATGNHREAQVALDSMSRTIPGHPGIFLAGARLHAAAAAYPEAEAQIRAYLATSPDAPRRQGIGEMTLARILWAAGRLDEGDAALDRAVAWQLRRGDTSAALREALAKVAAQVWLRRDRDEAARQLDAALRAFPLTAIAADDQPLPELATVQALVGRANAAAQTLADHAQGVPAALRHRTGAAVALATTTLAVARGDGEGARAAHRRYLASPVATRGDLPDALYQRWVRERLALRQTETRSAAAPRPGE